MSKKTLRKAYQKELALEPVAKSVRTSAPLKTN